MKKSLMFKIAHSVARQIVAEVGDYQIAFKLALKDIWNGVKTAEKGFNEDELVDSLKEILHDTQVAEGKQKTVSHLAFQTGLSKRVLPVRTATYVHHLSLTVLHQLT
ncbi:hypothetical protein [Secundilactobacillus similis]|uniref:hypothetical protein n=1 Tax=Secundilactobacillus similis TaxID=414682 RepID=UPI0006D17F48|nr:hypothetical protein [Secundilactobacillus similis]